MSQLFDIGMVGLGVMGRNLLLNLADHGFRVIGLDTDPAKVEALKKEGNRASVDATTDAQAFLAAQRLPRAVILLVPAGKAVDAVIDELAPRLQPGDLLIDAGNSQFKDTDRRHRELAGKQLNFFGIGVSGGESGARHGPSMMPGGPKAAYDRVRPMLEAIAAKVNGEPCVAYVGSGSSGHYVKMVHNGIEYGIMQLLAEIYDLLRRGAGLTNPELAEVFERWNQGELNSFLIEITAKVFRKLDPKTGKHLVDVILDVARQKGTGKWTSQEAMDLQVPLLTIDAAVAMRDMSAYDAERVRANQRFGVSVMPLDGDRARFLEQARNALSCATLLTYAQGFAMLRKASTTYDFGLDLASVAAIWRGGCIIRAAVLEKFRAAFTAQPDLPNLLLDEAVAKTVLGCEGDLRVVVKSAIDFGIPVAGLMNALAYFDAYRTARLPTNLTQAQRDFFGAHTFERIDEAGKFHANWEGPD
ncbi:MAG: NADP-dependent phosphogluconate dehydrogenase [Planctomycetes bacterium]|nr:NADP-dependent phosphogluconate dehydrogenase [Planctomycetota bacterium]